MVHRAKILFYGITGFACIILGGCATSYVYVSPELKEGSHKKVGIHISVSTDAYYGDLDCKNMPYFQAIQKELIKRNWLCVEMTDISPEKEKRPQYLEEARKKGNWFFMSISCKFSGYAKGIPCRKVKIVATMYNTHTKELVFTGTEESKDIEIFDEYPAITTGHYPAKYKIFKTYYYQRRELDWEDLYIEVIEKVLRGIP